MQEVVYIEMDYDSFIVLCESMKIVAQVIKKYFPFVMIYLMAMQPLQFFAPEIKKLIKEKTTKKKKFRGLEQNGL